MLISVWKIGKKQVDYTESRIVYENEREEKEQYNNTQDYLADKQYDWITLTETAINYPLMKGEDNQYYLSHNHLGEENASGAIYYDATDEPYNGTITIIYGHSMKDGTMANNLHYFHKNTNIFDTATLIISTKDSERIYKPFAYTIEDADKLCHREIDSLTTDETLSIIKEKSDFYKEDNYENNKHLIGFITCNYSKDGDRLIVWFIEE